MVGTSAKVPLRMPPTKNIRIVPAAKFMLFNRSRFRNDRSSAVAVWTMKR